MIKYKNKKLPKLLIPFKLMAIDGLASKKDTDYRKRIITLEYDLTHPDWYRIKGYTDESDEFFKDKTTLIFVLSYDDKSILIDYMFF